MNKQACQKWIKKRESGNCCVKKRKNKKFQKKSRHFQTNSELSGENIVMMPT